MICLLPNCAFLSSVSRVIEIHRALRARGVVARVATHGGTYEWVLRAAGISYDIVGPRMDEQRCAEFLRAEVGVGSVRQSMYTDAELRAYVAAEASYFRAHDIRVAVTGFMLTTVLSTRLAGVRLVTEHTGSWVPPVYERGLLPAPSETVLPGTRLLPAPVVRRLWNAAPTHVRYYCGGFNRVAAELGIDGVPSLPALLLGDLSLVPEAPEVLGIPAAELEAWRPDGRRAYRPQTRLRYSGPLYARLPIPVPDEVERFLDGPRPVVYVAITSSAAELVRGVVASLTGLGVRVLVAGTVHGGLVSSPDVLVAGVLPSHLVMPRVDLAVIAGGQGSVQTALAAGTPLVGIPLQPEQDLNVVLAERVGAGRRIAPRHTRSRVAKTVLGMLGDASYALAARAVADVYSGIDGAGNAADAICAVADDAAPVRGAR